MPENTTVNKVIVNGVTKLDLTEDTVTPSDVVSGKTFHSADGVQKTGSFDTSDLVRTDAVQTLTNKIYDLGAANSNKVLVTDSSGNISASSITDTELGHLSGVTSNIQTQLNNKADDSDVVHIAGDGATPEEITGVKDFSYGHGGAQDDNNPSVRAARLRITGQVATSTSQKSVSQVDFYLGNEAIGYMGCTRQNGKTYLKVASQGQTTPLIFGYLPYSDNFSCIRFEKDKPVWRGGQTGTYNADKALAVVGDIKSGTYTMTNKTISIQSNTINGFTANKVLVSDANGKLIASSCPANRIGVGTVHQVTLPSDVTGQAYYVVTNSICHLYVTGLDFSGLNGKTISNVVPKAKLTGHNFLYQGNQIWVSGGSSDLNIYKLADIALNGSVEYPVADDWVES